MHYLSISRLDDSLVRRYAARLVWRQRVVGTVVGQHECAAHRGVDVGNAGRDSRKLRAAPRVEVGVSGVKPVPTAYAGGVVARGLGVDDDEVVGFGVLVQIDVPHPLAPLLPVVGGTAVIVDVQATTGRLPLTAGGGASRVLVRVFPS